MKSGEGKGKREMVGVGGVKGGGRERKLQRVQSKTRQTSHKAFVKEAGNETHFLSGLGVCAVVDGSWSRRSYDNNNDNLGSLPFHPPSSRKETTALTRRARAAKG